MDPTEHTQAVTAVRKVLIEHASLPPGGTRPITIRCNCSANVLDHKRHQAEIVVSVLRRDGLL